MNQAKKLLGEDENIDRLFEKGGAKSKWVAVDAEHNARLACSVEVGNTELEMLFSGTFHGKKVSGVCTYGTDSPDSNVINFTSDTYKKLSKVLKRDDVEDLMYVLDDAPGWQPWVKYAMSSADNNR